MSFGVFIHRSDSIYDDSPAERYQFPSQYLKRAQDCVGDWIVYYEPTTVRHTRGYFAIARVQQVIPDPSTEKMFLAIIAPGSYLDFSKPVPFRNTSGILEQGLLNEEGAISGRAQAAVRPISASDFSRIVSRGLAEATPPLPRVEDTGTDAGFGEEAMHFDFDDVPERPQVFVSRKSRDRIFRSVVLQAYECRCALTGWKLINGGGRAEVEAAHILPVERGGPDTVNNGIALSGTVHWMFDRGLISLGDDLSILISRKVNDIDGVRAMLNKSRRAHSPRHKREQLHPTFLKWHRENRFEA